MIYVGNRRHNHTGEYVGRPSPLGNPFRIGYDGNRSVVIKKYEKWFMDMLIVGNEEFHIELRRLGKLAETQDLTLVCWCSPAKCHADVIRDYLNESFEIFES